MFLYFDKNGVLKEIINDKALRKASSGTIYAFFDGDVVFNDLYFYIKKSNDETLTHSQAEMQRELREIPSSRDRKLNYFEYFKKYNFYKYDLQSEDLNVAGLWELTIQGYDLNLSPYAFGSFIGLVENNAIKVDTNITQAEYEELKKLIATKSNWNDVETYIGVTREEVKPTNYTDYLKKNVFNLSFESLPYDETRVYKIKFNNDSYIVKNYDDEIDNLKNQYNALLSFDFEVLDKLPTTGEKGKLYWLNLGNNLYDVYIWDGTEFKLIFNDLTFLPTSYATKTDFENNSANKLIYKDDGFTLINQKGEEIPNQSDKVQVPQINSKRLIGDYDIEVFEAGGEVENVEDTNHRTPKEAMLEPYTIDISDKETLNYAEYNILIRQSQNYLIYDKNLLKLSNEDDNYYYYCNNKFNAKLSKTANDDNEYALDVSENTLVKFFITGTDVYISSTIVALSHKSNGDADVIKSGDYPANGSYNTTKQVYKLNYNYTEQDRYVVTLYFTDGTNITLNAGLIVSLSIIFTMEDF